MSTSFSFDIIMLVCFIFSTRRSPKHAVGLGEPQPVVTDELSGVGALALVSAQSEVRSFVSR